MEKIEKSWSERLNSVIPGGAHTYSRGDDQYPSNSPQILEKGKGCYVWDPDGKKFLDYGMALRAVTIGYAEPRINSAAFKQMENGVNLTRPSLIELQAAEALSDLIPCAEMVKFAKNGSNVTTAAAKIARAYTGRKYICIPRQHPFFSFDDWFIGVTPIKRGIPEEHYSSTLLFNYNSLASLEDLFNQYPDQIAGVMLEPATTIDPCPKECTRVRNLNETCNTCSNKERNFLYQVKELCHKNSALFILDEMITGFRWDIKGAQNYFGVIPDLATFGKGMANGFSVTALVGKKEFLKIGGIKEEGMERTFLVSTTYGAEMHALGALVETINMYKEFNIVKHFWEYGSKLFEGFNRISKSHGLQDKLFMDGGYVCMNYVTKDNNGEVSLPFRTLFSQEMIKNGILMPWIAISYAHKEEELNYTFEVLEKVMEVYKKAINEGIDNYLVGPSIKPVFRKFN